jgi:putative spermidine/putrescine transport system ATP-binding protein
MSAFIHFDRISKVFSATPVVEDLDLEVTKGEFLSLLGPSGSGKTTILMMLAGFESPTEGRILLDGRRIDQLPPHKRQMGVVFQNYALFPHLSVGENVAFPLEMRRCPRHEIAARVNKALDMVRLAHLADRKPAQLSGGQQQRVALTRALVFEPSVILMDEPLGALDKQLRENMQLEIRDLHRRLGVTVVFVTHDQSEALTMSDRIAVLNGGRIEQLDTPQGIYDSPRSRFVAQFIGETNLMEGTVAALNGTTAETVLNDGVTRLVVPAGDRKIGERIAISLRPERIALHSEAKAANALPVAVADAVYHGDHLRLQLSAGPCSLISKCGRQAVDWTPGSAGFACFQPEDCAVVV